jgi:twitching motility two-component system response regulator PilH
VAVILIADDSPTAVALLERALEPLGHRLVAAADGAEAARALAQAEPPVDLAILDIVMPGPNGFELCRAAKSDPRTARIPIVLVTSMDREVDRYWGKKQGADAYLVKPFDPDALRACVRELLSQGGAG